MIDSEIASILADYRLRLDKLENQVATCVEFRNVEPEKPREGMVYGADGTNWNPGSGQGLYCYYNSTWNKL